MISCPPPFRSQRTVALCGSGVARPAHQGGQGSSPASPLGIVCLPGVGCAAWWRRRAALSSLRGRWRPVARLVGCSWHRLLSQQQLSLPLAVSSGAQQEPSSPAAQHVQPSKEPRPEHPRRLTSRGLYTHAESPKQRSFCGIIEKQTEKTQPSLFQLWWWSLSSSSIFEYVFSCF